MDRISLIQNNGIDEAKWLEFYFDLLFDPFEVPPELDMFVLLMTPFPMSL